MARQPLNISHPSQLAQLALWPGMRPSGPKRIRIDAQDLPPERAGSWEGELNRLYNACGCDTAALGLTLGLVGYLTLAAARSSPLGWNELWRGLGAVVTLTAVGKLVGLWRAHRRLAQRIGEIQSEWRAPSLPDAGPIRCG